jgi:hypothetical protein
VTAHGPQMGVIFGCYTLIDREPPESTAGLLRAGAGVFFSGPLQLARRPAGTLDKNLTLLAHEDVLCARQLAPLTLVGVP